MRNWCPKSGNMSFRDNGCTQTFSEDNKNKYGNEIIPYRTSCGVEVGMKPREYDLSSQTSVNWYFFIREGWIDHLIKSRAKNWAGAVKSSRSTRQSSAAGKYNRGRVLEEQWVFGGIERGTGNSFLVPVDTRDADTLLRIIRKTIEPGTTIVSDCWKAYRSLEKAGLEHFTVNHSIEFINARTGAHTNPSNAGGERCAVWFRTLVRSAKAPF